MKKQSKRILSVLIAVLVVFSALPLSVYAAIDTSSMALVSADTDCDLAKVRWNETITYTIVTKPNATRVKIVYPNGELYALADIGQGFKDYTDSSDSRTWTISRRNQWIGERTYHVYAGTSEVYDANYVTLKCGTLSEGGMCYCTQCGAEYKYGEKHSCSGGTEETDPDEPDTKTEPPYPFWQDYLNYSVVGTKVYYQGNIYENQWYANAGALPTDGGAWVLVGPAEWTVEEDPSNYTKPEGGDEAEINKILTDAEVNALWGGINEEYSTENALGRLEELIPQSYYEELFPYRFGSENWKASDAAKAYYPDTSAMPDYYSYDNLKAAITELSDIIIKVEWYDDAAWCYRLTRLNKSTLEQKLIYSDPSFGEEWLETTKDKKVTICDYGSFLAVGDLTTRKKELAGFLANISHETGGGSVDGNVDELYTGLFFNEEVGLINSTAENYVQSSGTAYLPVPGKSYHGRGPIQISYNYNYGLCSDVIYGDSSILLEDPDLVDRDGVVGFMTGIWFWMTPQPPKPSCHQVITATWEPGEGATNAEYNGQFGLTIVIINNESGQSENGSGAVARRCRYFRAFCAKMGVDLGSEQVDTMGMTSFVQS